METKPTIVFNEKAKPKDKPIVETKKGMYLDVGTLVNSNLYQKFIRYEDADKIIDCYEALKVVYANLETELQRKNMMKASDINQAFMWHQYDIDGWHWAACFTRCSKNKKKALAEEKKAKQEEQAI